MITNILNNPQTEREQALIDFIRLLESGLDDLPHRVIPATGMSRRVAHSIEGRAMLLILHRARLAVAQLGNVGIDHDAIIGELALLAEALDMAGIQLYDLERIKP